MEDSIEGVADTKENEHHDDAKPKFQLHSLDKKEVKEEPKAAKEKTDKPEKKEKKEEKEVTKKEGEKHDLKPKEPEHKPAEPAADEHQEKMELHKPSIHTGKADHPSLSHHEQFLKNKDHMSHKARQGEDHKSVGKVDHEHVDVAHTFSHETPYHLNKKHMTHHDYDSPFAEQTHSDDHRATDHHSVPVHHETEQYWTSHEHPQHAERKFI